MVLTRRQLLRFLCHPSSSSPPLARQFSSKNSLVRAVAFATAGSRAFRVANSLDHGASARQSCSCCNREALANAAAKIGRARVVLSTNHGCHGFGLGTIIDEDGTILTSSSLVRSSKGKVEVGTRDGEFEGTVVSGDFSSDMAIVKMKCETPLPAAKLGSSSKLRVGEWVVATCLSGKPRNATIEGTIRYSLGAAKKEYLETDYPYYLGSYNYGGPVVNMDGEVIGLTVARRSRGTVLNCIAPIDSAKRMIEHLKRDDGGVARPWLGMKMIDGDVSGGVLVRAVSPGSPADGAGLCRRDIILEVEGKTVGSVVEVLEIMAADKIGKPLRVVVERPPFKDTLTLTLIPQEAKNPTM